MSRTPGNPSAPVNSAVWTTDNYAVDAGLSVDQDRRRDEFDKRMLRIGSRFERVEPRRRAALVRGLADGSIAGRSLEHSGDTGSRGMQRKRLSD
jgi:hypothetical protein